MPKRSVVVVWAVALLASLPVVAGVQVVSAPPAAATGSGPNMVPTYAGFAGSPHAYRLPQCAASSSSGGSFQLIPPTPMQPGPSTSGDLWPHEVWFQMGAGSSVTVDVDADLTITNTDDIGSMWDLELVGPTGSIYDAAVWGPVNLPDGVAVNKTGQITLTDAAGGWYKFVLGGWSFADPQPMLEASFAVSGASVSCPAHNGVLSPAGGRVADPVDTWTGNFTHTKSLLSYPAYVFGMDLTATYNSLDPSPSTFRMGWGWTTSLDVLVAENPAASTLEYRAGDGRRATLTPAGTDLWLAPEGMVGSLAKLGGGTYALQLQSGERHEFDSAGRLVKKCQGRPGWSVSTGSCAGSDAGQVVTVEWTGAQISQVRSSLGASSSPATFTQTFTYWGPHLYQIVAHDDTATSNDRVVTMTYSGTLVDGISDPYFSAETSTRQWETYGFDSGFVGRIASVSRTPSDPATSWPLTSSAVAMVTNTYDQTGRVVEQVNESGDTIDFDWSTTNQLTVEWASTGESMTYVHDSAGRLVSVVDPSPGPKTMSKEWGQGGTGDPFEHQTPGLSPTQVTGRDGAPTAVFFDQYGRVAKTAAVDPAGGSGWWTGTPQRYDDTDFSAGQTEGVRISV